MSAQITVNDFKWIKGENDQEYIGLLLDALERQKKITAKAIAKVKELRMRDATPEERKSVDNYVKSISKDTGVTFEQNSPSQMPGTSDLINRQEGRVMTLEEAIEELQLTIDLIKQNGKDWLDERDIPILSMAIEAMKELKELREQKSPSQPGTSDLISRQAAIDEVDSETVSTNPEHFRSSEKFNKFMDDADIASFGKWKWAKGFNTALVATTVQLEKLPSVQSELEDKIRAIGYTGKEGRIYIGGRLFAVRELPQ